MSDRTYVLAGLKDESELKQYLNTAVVELFQAERTQLRPHLCLNGEHGMEMFEKLRRDRRTPTEYWIHAHPIIDGDVWLNVQLILCVEKYTMPTNQLWLTPQQTSCVAQGLPEPFRSEVIGKIKQWFSATFLPQLKLGLEKIEAQFATGDSLIESDHENRIFDLHGWRGSLDIPYTETDIAGKELFWAFIYGDTWMDAVAEIDGYERADAIIRLRRERQQAALPPEFRRKK